MAGEKGRRATSSQPNRGSRFRGLMRGESSKVRFIVFFALLLVTVALYVTPAGEITVNRASGLDTTFRILISLAPPVIGALLLGLVYGTLLGAGLSLAMFMRAILIPTGFFDQILIDPIYAFVPVVITLIAAGLIFALFGEKLFSPNRRVWVPCLAVACILIAVIYDAARILCYVAVFSSDVSELVSSAQTIVANPMLYANAVCLAAVLLAACIAAAHIYRMKMDGKLDRSMRGVFRRWLLVFVSIAFITSLSITYSYETAQSRQTAKETLDCEVLYLEQQIDDHEARTSQLVSLENGIVLEKARDVADAISRNPAILDSTSSVRALADEQGVSSLTVTDGKGTVIADADGQGIGIYNFGEYDQTKQYMLLLSVPTATVVESPRASVDSSGQETTVHSLFAGMPRTDQTGIIQISVPASDYERVLSAASIEHLGDNYHVGKEGGVIVIQNGTIVTASMTEAIGHDADEVIDVGEADIWNGDLLPLSDEQNEYLGEAARYGDYRLVVYMTTNEIFAARDSIMVWSTFLYIVLFLVVFMLASRLLSSVVIDGINKTNSTLGRITEGDLNQKVDVHSNIEFDSLSDGINTTVDALKDSISEASARIDRELATAHAIQLSALPGTFPPFPEISDFDIYASMNPAREVGGDFYDFFLIDEQRLGFVVADVSGKGIPAALFMMTAKTEIANYMQSSDDLGGAISTVNHHLCEGNEAGMFVTAFMAVLDFTTGELIYVNAGHNPPLLRHDGAWEWVRDKSGLFLGAMDDIRYKSFTRTIVHGDELLLYTDGVTEAWNKDGKMYGEARLLEMLQAHANLHPTALVHKMENTLANFEEGTEQADDITLLSLEYGEAPDVSDSIRVPARTDQLEVVLGFVHGELARRLCPIKQQKQLDIAIEELFVNIAHYAYPEATDEKPGMAQVTYTYNATPPCITVELDDTGLPYDPLKRADPEKPASAEEAKIGGLGIMMAKKCVDEIDYRWEKGHNIITLSKSW